MKKALLIISAIALIAVPVLATHAAEDIKTQPIPISPTKIDLNGTWNYSSTASKVTGPCPADPPKSGTLVMTQKGKNVTLKYTSGAVCKPKSMCSYTGTLNGNQLSLTNHDTVDNEGGNVTNALGLVVASNESVSGMSSSRYVHPGGMECHWESQAKITRKAKDKK